MNRDPIEVPKELAEKLGELAQYGFYNREDLGWTFITSSTEGQKYGYLLTAVLHRNGDPPDEAWETTFDVQSENEVFIWGETLTFRPRKKVVKVVKVVTWELPMSKAKILPPPVDNRTAEEKLLDCIKRNEFFHAPPYKIQSCFDSSSKKDIYYLTKRDHDRGQVIEVLNAVPFEEVVKELKRVGVF